MRLDINYRKKSVKNTNTWRLNNTLLNNQEITEEIKRYVETNDNKNTTTKHMGCSKSSSKRAVYSNTILPQETRNFSNKQSNHTPQAFRERRTNKNPKLSRRKEIIGIRSERNEKK